jgi:hypothetical protein
MSADLFALNSKFSSHPDAQPLEPEPDSGDFHPVETLLELDAEVDELRVLATASHT